MARFAILLLLVGGTGCDGPAPPALSRTTLVGDGVCLQCHGEFGDYSATAHSRSSALASAEAIHGSFTPGENILETANPFLHFRMEDTGEGFRQVALQTAGDTAVVEAAPMDIVIGSGRKGQTYLHWDADRLYQLPVSYWTGIGWANSPGYPSGIALFNRPVNPRCLECHATYAEALPSMGAENLYDPATFTPGISCESCHGAGAEHVAAARRGRIGGWLRHTGIVDPGDLARERRIDGCALCHGGVGESVRPPFTYRPGEPLSEYVHQPEPGPDEAVDVHGNQVALLARSPCFVGSRMTCSTCHEVHRPQRDVAEFSAACTSCHTPGDEIDADHGDELPGNCVDCHMPNLATNVIVANGAGGVLQPRVRSHWIRVYPEISAELARISESGESPPGQPAPDP